MADQKLQRSNGFDYSSAIYTRQNPTGNRRGYECPEERDYYPYWHPNPWKDIAVFVQDTSLCEFYSRESHNVVPRGECWEGSKPLSRWNNQAQCEENGGRWSQCECTRVSASTYWSVLVYTGQCKYVLVSASVYRSVRVRTGQC